MLDFGHSRPIHMYAKQLLVCFHGGYLWLNKPYEVMVDLIFEITSLLGKGIDPALYLSNEGEKTDKNNMKTKYQLIHGENGFLVISIEDSAVQAIAKILCSKVLRKMRPAECTAATVELTKKCAQGVHINWSQFLLNELLDDA